MRPERVTVLRRNVPIRLLAEVSGVFRTPVVVPGNLRERLTGIKRVPPGHGVLLATATVHSVGLKHPLTVLALDELGSVLAVHRLAPNRTWRCPGAAWIVELDQVIPVSPGSQVRLLGRIAGT